MRSKRNIFNVSFCNTWTFGGSDVYLQCFFSRNKKETINVEDQSKVVVCLTKKKKDRKGVKWSCAQHSCEQNR